MVYRLPPAEFSEILGIPQKSKWRRNVTRYLSKLEVGEFYKTAKLEHFISNGLVTDGVQSLNFDGEFPGILMWISFKFAWEVPTVDL